MEPARFVDTASAVVVLQKKWATLSAKRFRWESKMSICTPQGSPQRFLGNEGSVCAAGLPEYLTSGNEEQAVTRKETRIVRAWNGSRQFWRTRERFLFPYWVGRITSFSQPGRAISQKIRFLVKNVSVPPMCMSGCSLTNHTHRAKEPNVSRSLMGNTNDGLTVSNPGLSHHCKTVAALQHQASAPMVFRFASPST